MDKLTTDALTLISGLSWTAVYVLIIIRSFRDKTYGMPFWALAFNLSWEFIFSVVLLPTSPEWLLQLWINRVWLLFDVAILVAYFKWGKKEWSTTLPLLFFYGYSVLVLITGYFFVYLLSVELDHSQGMYAAFIQNLMMSWLFIRMVQRRKSTSGQAIGIAVLKLIGTLAPTIIYGVKSPFVMFLGLSCFMADAVYLFLLIRTRRKTIDWKTL